MNVTQEGLDRLLLQLEGLGADGMTLPAENVTGTLAAFAARDPDRSHFDVAWSAAINRVQPSQIGGVVDARLEAELRESRAMLEEDRPYFRALYEGREQTTRERAQRTAAAWRRMDQRPNTPAANRRRQAERID